MKLHTNITLPVFCRAACCRAAAVLLCCALLAGCGSAAPAASEAAAAASAAPEAQQQGTLTIAVSDEGYNPYLTANTLVEQAAGLLFEKLVEIAPDMRLDYRLAQTVQSAGLTVTIQLRGGCRFADGSEITAADVAASLQAAQASAMYGARLANVAAIEVQGQAVVLTLHQPDSLFAYLLDLPVLPAGQVALPSPTASGRYTYGGSGDTLVRNPYAPFAEDGPGEIQLTAIARYEEMVSGMALGTVDVYLADGSGANSIAATESYFRTNTLLFLGVNAGSQNPLCSTAEGRRQLSALVSRRELAMRYANSYAATGALNGAYPCVSGRQQILIDADDSTLPEAMAALGYTYDQAAGYYVAQDGARAAVSVLVNAADSYKRYAATLLQQQWQDAGIEVALVEAADHASCLQMIQNREFDLYIGEIKLYNNMDLSPFWSGNARWGLAVSEELAAAYSALRASAGAAGAFEAAFAAEMPYIPLAWRSGVAVTSRRVSGLTPSQSNLYYSLAGLTVQP